MKKPRFLISSPVTPFPLQPWNDPATDIARQRFTKNQDIFTMVAHWHLFAGHLIAQNVSAPTVILEHPTMENWENEVRKGYDYVGITSLTPNMEDCLEMFRVVRRLSPQSQTVFGSFAAFSFDNFYPEGAEERELVDHIVYGPEGVNFFRKLAGDPAWNLGEPIREHFWPLCGSALPWVDKHPGRQMGTMVASYGCPNGCDFCTTTAQYRQQRFRVLTPAQLVEELRLIRRRWPEVESVTVLDEDHEPAYFQEYGRLIENDPDFRLDEFELFFVSSISSLAAWENLDDIARCGITSTFIGMESKFAPSEGYQKRAGDAERIVEELHRRGIATTFGFILGFDFHDRSNVLDDIWWMVNLEPTMAQVTRVTPYPGTPIYERLQEEGRIKEFTWDTVSFFGGGHVPKNFTVHELMSLITTADKLLYETWGPSIMRQLKLDLKAYEYFKEHPDPRLREQRARLHKKKAMKLYPMIRACEQFAPNGAVRKLIKDLETRWICNFGEPSTAQKIQSQFILAKAAKEKVRNFFNDRNRDVKIEPAKKYIYPGNGRSYDHGEVPYRVVYLNQDRGYERDRTIQRVQETLFQKVTSLANTFDELRGRKLDPDMPRAAGGIRVL